MTQVGAFRRGNNQILTTNTAADLKQSSVGTLLRILLIVVLFSAIVINNTSASNSITPDMSFINRVEVVFSNALLPFDSLFGGRLIKNKRDTSIVIAPQKVSVFEQNLTPLYDYPKKVIVSSQDIIAPVTTVGVDDSGKLENPSSWTEAGWFYNSARPGETGNMIINAHYDTNFGAPAVFWNLKNISVGDKVDVVDSLGKVYTYKVTETFYVDIQDPDRLKIFKDNEADAELTLITCGGVWLPGRSTYNKRLVVKALIDSDILSASTFRDDSSSEVN